MTAKEPGRKTLDQESKPDRPEPQRRKIDHEIDLDLQSRRQRYALKDMTHTQFQVLSIRGCDAPYAIKPKNGLLDRKSDVKILISGLREIVIQLDYKASTQGKASIAIECNVTSDAGDKVPFTLPNLDRVCRQITAQGEQAVSAGAAMEAERTRIKTWIAAPILKSLTERGKARARVMELDIAIPNQSELVQSLRDDLSVAEDLRALANRLDDDCVIEIAVAE